MDKYFYDYYPEIFYGASGLKALTTKVDELESFLLNKDSFLSESFIEPNIRKFNKRISKDIVASNISEEQRLVKELTEGLFGIKESIDDFSHSILTKKKYILLEGEAGSGKTVFGVKLAQKVIDIAIQKLSLNKKSKHSQNNTQVPIFIKALDLPSKSIGDLIENYYIDSTYNFTPVVIIVDGLDELKSDLRSDVINNTIAYVAERNMSLVFTSRKNYNLINDLDGFIHYQILPFELTQAINYIKRLVTNNETLLASLLKGIEQIEHQIPLYPMAISLLVKIVREHNEVPASISELYKRYINLALGEQDLSKGIEVLFEYKIKRNFLGELAYKLFFVEATTYVDYKSFCQFTQSYINSHPHINNLSSFIEELKRSSLLKFDGENVEFLHKSFLDYFIADYFYSNRDDLEDNEEFKKIYELYYSEFWYDVTLFFFGIQTKITKQKLAHLISLGEEKCNNSDSLFNFVELFMLGRLMQYAWDSKSDAKELAISCATGLILNIKHSMLGLLREGTGINNLPTISSDIAVLHLFDLSYSSLFLAKEIENYVSSNFSRMKSEEKIASTNDKAIIYFASAFILTNHKIITQDFMRNFFEQFIILEKKVDDKELIIPIIGLFNFLLKKEFLKVDTEVKKYLQEEYHELSKKFSGLMSKTFIVKNKNDQPYYRRLNP